MAPDTKTKRAGQKRVRELHVPITGGSIRNGYVSVREHLWFFPKEVIRNGRPDDEHAVCILELEGFGEIESDIDASRGIFRWRGWRKFFEHAEVGEGDELIFRKLESDRFAVTVRHQLLDGLQPSADAAPRPDRPVARRPSRRCNDLSGEEWLRSSISIWSDVKKTAEETSLNHPAMFPSALCERLMLMFLRRKGKHRILDPFAGSGSVLIAARNLGKHGIGLDISDEYLALARRRLENPGLFTNTSIDHELIQADARQLSNHVKPKSVDLCITSPPYWNILNQRRTADYKEIRHYGNRDADLGVIADYEQFLDELGRVFEQVFETLRPGAYCAIVVMDLRKKNQFFPLHSDLAARLSRVGFIYDDLIIWDRGQEYNNLRPLGYPSVFRVNKVHEYILLFQKPKGDK